MVELEKMLRMKEGAGRDSYMHNSQFQEAMISTGRLILEESVKELYHDLKPECLIIADFGCASGSNTLSVISQIIDIVDANCKGLNKKAPQFGIFLNDLVGNDFNTLFSLLPSFYSQLEERKGKDFGPCFVSATPKSFYGRVFPDGFLHIVHSSASMHWLSEVPKILNKGQIYIAKTSPPEVKLAYFEQFGRDFRLFLRSRASELVSGGRMILTFSGDSQGARDEYELFGSALNSMALEGLIDEDKFNLFNLPFYGPTTEEVRDIVEAEGSFYLNKLESFFVDDCIDELSKTTQITPERQAAFIARTTRSAFEPLLASALCMDEPTIIDTFLRFEENIKEHIATNGLGTVNTIVCSMTKL